MAGNTSKRYPAELKARAVRMYGGVRSDHESDWAAMEKVAQLLGITTAETLRKWVRRAEIDQGERPGVTSKESAEVKRLKRENAADTPLLFDDAGRPKAAFTAVVEGLRRRASGG